MLCGLRDVDFVGLKRSIHEAPLAGRRHGEHREVHVRSGNQHRRRSSTQRRHQGLVQGLRHHHRPPSMMVNPRCPGSTNAPHSSACSWSFLKCGQRSERHVGETTRHRRRRQRGSVDAPGVAHAPLPQGGHANHRQHHARFRTSRVGRPDSFRRRSARRSDRRARKLWRIP